jgi:ADP-ribosylglycohydrolase
LTLKEEMEVVNGGNTDGIAALTGSLVGSAVGLQGIDHRWRTVEDYERITQIAEELIETLNVMC